MMRGNLHFTALGGTVRGTSHQKNGLPNQDFLAGCEQVQADRSEPNISFVDGELPNFITVAADGHGGKAYTRSHIGSEKAVIALINLLKGISRKELVDSGTFPQNFVTWQSNAESVLVDQWRRMVEADFLLQNQTTPTELDRMDIWKLYGTTLLGCIVTEEYCICVQIGDGELWLSWEDGRIERAFPLRENHIGNETASLCQSDAKQEIEMRLILNSSEGLPSTILICTDGFSNAYSSEEGFRKAVSDIHHRFVQGESALMREELGEWLKTAGSCTGDDVTLSLLHIVKP